ncbi:MAG: hypothetical protein A2W93_01795 [Bacteroidetes bacterium GWF2_43_63]|nr:MAG: hypothetical protein A2W94_10280 [Bacteroidetes bacterium GWE2_42_42]OFY55797.1 MAG: hypothetical protein A2W93_01795 [Bacteroidetes bacterium GWF2_43_63]HBG71283.1 hypothetical protein [Bacteroidales bacterium]HCB60496.1 hypothetical protein [Bacteroidales bacterium]HCY22547.1 hypothetical protein [Bacteroidales bacterium]
MSHKIRYRLLTLNARFLRNLLAVIGIAGFMSACSGSGKTENNVNQDSLNKAKEQQSLDSIAMVKEDSLAQVRADSLAKVRKDSIARANYKPLPGNMVTKYGVPVNTDRPMQTKYGPPSDFQN